MRIGRVAGLLLLSMASLGFLATSSPLRVVATTTIVADVVEAIAGGLVEVRSLLPIDSDPHGYQPTPRDVVALAEADVVFLSGAGLEDEFDDLLENAGRIVDLSERVAVRGLGHAESEADDHGEGVDPHVWFDPTNVMVWTRAIEETLAELDPAHAVAYAANAAAHRRELAELDLWIWAETSRISPTARRLVTDHVAFGYFAARYGFEQVGSVFPGFTTLAEPSARELAQLVDAVRALGVPAIFVGASVSPTLAEAVAADANAAVVFLYTGSLTGPTGPAGSYLDLMRHDVSVIVGALTAE